MLTGPVLPVSLSQPGRQWSDCGCSWQLSRMTCVNLILEAVVPFLVKQAVGESHMKSLGLENADYLKTACMPLLTPFYKQEQCP